MRHHHRDETCPCAPCSRLARDLEAIPDFDDEPGQERLAELDCDGEMARLQRYLSPDKADEADDAPPRWWRETFPGGCQCEFCGRCSLEPTCGDCRASFEEIDHRRRVIRRLEAERATWARRAASEAPF